MPFYKKDNEELLVAPNFVFGPDFELRAETKDEHVYPTGGWYWFDTLEDAINGLSNAKPSNIVSRRQARLALLEVGLLDDVENYINSIEDPIAKRQAQIEYEADPWDRDNQYLINMWTLLGGTEQTLNEMFAVAATK